MKTIHSFRIAFVSVAAILCSTPSQEAEEVRLTARLNESNVVRPAEFQPPIFGTGSPGSGFANIVVDTETAEYSFEMEITGIDPEILDNTVGPNRTAIHVHAGPSHARGPFTIDAHHFARQTLPDSNGLTVIEGGFRLEASGAITQIQGDLDTTFTPSEIIESLLTEESFVAVHTNDNDLFRTGAIRGNFGYPAVRFVRSDCNGDQKTDIADVVFSLDHLFGAGVTPGCLEACNVNDDAEYNISDPVSQLTYLFEGGSPISAPFPFCDIDPNSPDGVGCAEGICD